MDVKKQAEKIRTGATDMAKDICCHIYVVVTAVKFCTVELVL
jgi:hypothetical protein